MGVDIGIGRGGIGEGGRYLPDMWSGQVENLWVPFNLHRVLFLSLELKDETGKYVLHPSSPLRMLPFYHQLTPFQEKSAIKQPPVRPKRGRRR